ncbi:MAG TPA: FAD:protein FMN transferase, partial [Acidimicrobiales bacterium]|nr:FAD:protein FMN transferase [Acidimicrobiales bacterium]
MPYPTSSVWLEPVMGTIVGFSAPEELPTPALSAAVAGLHDADRVFSTWNPESPMTRLRSGQTDLEEIDPGDARKITEVLERCELARELTGGSFDPWAMPGGIDPTGLVKGWAVARAAKVLTGAGMRNLMVNAGGDIAVTGSPPGRRWTVGIRHPDQPRDLAAVIEVESAIATSGDYERPGQLIDPHTGRAARAAASATVTGPDLDLADALATGLAVAGESLLDVIEKLPGYEGYLITA